MTVGDIWMDSRKLRHGDVFVALRGSDGNDGHAYVESALRSGAVAAIVARDKAQNFRAGVRKKLIRVDDPLRAIRAMAARRRAELGIPIIAVTGSNGKTTTRQFITSVLRKRLAVGETFSNWNNEIGVPLSLLRFDEQCEVGVLELAANHLGEISPMSRMVKPDIVIITNIGTAHIGYFKTLANTTRAKFEIVDGLRSRGVVLLNGDDARLRREASRRGLPATYFGFGPRCDMRARDMEATREGAAFLVDGIRYAAPVLGRHFIYSALPAIWCGRRFGVAESDIREALQALRIDPLRGAVAEKNGVTFIVDCYNANPSSMKSAIDSLVQLADAGRAGAIVGDMNELGAQSQKRHRELGERLAKAGVRKILAIGACAEAIAAGVRANGAAVRMATAPDAETGTGAAREMFTRGDTVLVKGSRSVGLEKVYGEFR
jgi:UDP-N-acetylmuramoyl-tripeptide--D-alanyl-D-alanine ligase